MASLQQLVYINQHCLHAYVFSMTTHLMSIDNNAIGHKTANIKGAMVTADSPRVGCDTEHVSACAM